MQEQSFKWPRQNESSRLKATGILEKHRTYIKSRCSGPENEATSLEEEYHRV